MHPMRETLLHCALIEGVGPAVIERIRKVLGDERIAHVYAFTVSDWMQRFGFSEKGAQRLVTGLSDTKLLERELELIEKHHISWCSLIDTNYPELLKAIYLPPTILFWRGTQPGSSKQALSIVGSRQANGYAQQVVDAFVPPLVTAGWAIVSGGALGADTMVHQATLKAKGETIAVIGAGLLRLYPASNRLLFEQIVAAGGSIVSPFPLEMQALPGNFPARNRIIAGLCRATIVVQAAEKSGARITALHALEQGREVCVVPGNIFDPLSAGCHRLLGEGATPVTSADDILRTFGYEPAVRESQMVIGQPAGDPLVAYCKTPQTYDDLLVFAGCEYQELQDKLFSLQLAGLVEQDFSGRWIASSL